MNIIHRKCQDYMCMSDYYTFTSLKFKIDTYEEQ